MAQVTGDNQSYSRTEALITLILRGAHKVLAYRNSVQEGGQHLMSLVSYVLRYNSVSDVLPARCLQHLMYHVH